MISCPNVDILLLFANLFFERSGNMKTSSYIGVTGCMSRYEVDRVLEAFPDNLGRKLMIGVLISDKTLRGISVRRPNRYPNPGDIGGIFSQDPKALNLLHFHAGMEDPERLLDQLLEITDLGGNNLHGLQLNMKWPDRDVLRRYRERHPSKVLVLQCGSGAIQSAGNDPRGLARMVSDYVDVCEYVLIDPSGGEGKPLIPKVAIDYLDHLHDRLDESMKYGVAGGLGIPGETTELLREIFEIFPSTSVDVEGNIRDQPGDSLNPGRACEYVREVSRLCYAEY